MHRRIVRVDRRNFAFGDDRPAMEFKTRSRTEDRAPTANHSASEVRDENADRIARVVFNAKIAETAEKRTFFLRGLRDLCVYLLCLALLTN